MASIIPRRFLLLYAKWFATVYCIVGAGFMLLVAYDLLLNKSPWGYPWYSLLILAGMIAVGLGIRKYAVRTLRESSQ